MIASNSNFGWGGASARRPSIYPCTVLFSLAKQPFVFVNSSFLPSRFRIRVKALAPQPQHGNGDYSKSKSLSFPLDTDKQPYPTYGNHPDFIAGYNSKSLSSPLDTDKQPYPAYGNHSDFIAGYNSQKGDILDILSLTPLGQTVDSIKSGIEGIEKALNEYEQTGSLSGVAWAGSILALEMFIERKLKIGKGIDVVTKSGKSLKDQATDLVTVNGNRNRVTLRSQNQQLEIDLDGKSHAGIPTPHTKVSPRNYNAPEHLQPIYNTSEKKSTLRPSTKEDIRTARRYLERKNR